MVKYIFKKKQVENANLKKQLRRLKTKLNAYEGLFLDQKHI